MNQHRRARRRASVYVLVLGCALIVTIIGLSAVLAVRVRRQTLDGGNDFVAARHAARSAIEVGIYAVSQVRDWRARLPNGTWLGPVTLGRGRFTIAGSDPDDGDLADAPSDPVVLTGIGLCGEARYQMEVTLRPPVVPLKALSTCLHAGGDIMVPTAHLVTATGAPLSTNGTFTSGGVVHADVEAAAVVATLPITGTITAPAPPKELPAAGVFGSYAARATVIPIAACSAAISGVVLSPASNPWGATDANGLYLIDTGGADLTVAGMRLVGTLLVRTRGGTVHIGPDVFFTSARPDFPVLVVDGNLDLRLFSTLALHEAVYLRSFNPPGTPCDGVADTDTLDAYPNVIRGLVHTTGNLALQESSRVRGVLICEGSATLPGQITLVYDPQLVAAPPEGYTTYGTPLIVPGSWRQTVAAGP